MPNINIGKDEEYFKYLIELRDIGVTNMRAAGPYLEGKFDVTAQEGIEILKRWINSFNPN